jgi:hypothetical protein
VSKNASYLDVLHGTLSKIAIVKPKDRPYLLSDGEGLHLQIYTSGSKLCVCLSLRRQSEHDVARCLPCRLSQGGARARRDQKADRRWYQSSLRRKLDKISASSANSFGAVADEYLANLKANGAAEITVSKNRWLLEDLAAPIRNQPVNEVLPAELLDILKKIEASGRRDTAHRLRSVMGAVFRLAVATLRATNDPTYALRAPFSR